LSFFYFSLSLQVSQLNIRPVVKILFAVSPFFVLLLCTLWVYNSVLSLIIQCLSFHIHGNSSLPICSSFLICRVSLTLSFLHLLVLYNHVHLGPEFLVLLLFSFYLC
jgi:hypothetical protein